MKSLVYAKISLLIVSILICISMNSQMRVFDDLRDIEIISSEHFNYVYKSPLREISREIAKIAEAQYSILSKTMKTHPYSKINILITDNADIPNGFAAASLNQTINIFMTNPEPSFISKHNHWIEFVLFHEMTHIFNMTATSPSCLKAFNNNLFYVPNSLMPLWVLEGYTIYNESTVFSGRLYDTNYESYLRSMILDSTVQSIHRAADGLNRRWPYGTLGYLYGGYIFEEYARNKNDLTNFNDLNFCTCLPLGMIFPDIMTKIKTGTLPTKMLDKAIGRAADRTEYLINNFYSADRFKISTQSGTNATPVYIKSQGGLFFNKFSEIKSKYFSSYNNGKIKELFRTSSSKSFSYDENNEKLYYEFLNLHNNQLNFYDIYVYNFKNGKSQILKNTTRGMYPVLINDKTLLFIRNRFDTQYFIIYDIESQMPNDSFCFEPSYRYYNPSIKDNKLLLAIYREGGYSDIGLIDIDTRTIEFLTENRETDFYPKWSTMYNGYYFISDIDGINKVYYAEIGNDTIIPIYESYYNVMSYDFNIKEDSIFVEDLTGLGYDIFASMIIKGNPTILHKQEYKGYEAVKKDIIIKGPFAYKPLLQYSAPGLTLAFPMFYTDPVSSTFFMFLMNTNSDIALGTGYNLNINQIGFRVDTTDSVTNYVYNIAADIYCLYFNPDINLYFNTYNDSNEYKPEYSEGGLIFTKNFLSIINNWGFSIGISEGFDSTITIGPNASIFFNNLQSGRKSVIPSKGISISLDAFGYYEKDTKNYNYGALIDAAYYNILFKDYSYYFKLHSEYDKNGNIFLEDSRYYSYKLDNLMKSVIYLPATADTTLNFNDISYVKIGTEIPLAFPGWGLPIDFLASTAIQLDYISTGIYGYYIYSYQNNYTDYIFGISLTSMFAIGGLPAANPTVAINYSSSTGTAFGFYLDFPSFPAY